MVYHRQHAYSPLCDCPSCEDTFYGDRETPQNGEAEMEHTEYPQFGAWNVDDKIKPLCQTCRSIPCQCACQAPQNGAAEMSERLYQRGSDGYPMGSDRVMQEAYGKIPDATEFLHGGWGYEMPHELFGWVWSVDYGCWRAVVHFSDGWIGVTSAKPFWAK